MSINKNNKSLYNWIIITFIALYALVGFVSTIHSTTFFMISNNMWMSVLLAVAYEIGQAAVLFSILMTENKNYWLPWILMILLTALQVTANVYASYKFMIISNSSNWVYWKDAILFWVHGQSPQMFKVIISWISGALLPIVALGMTALIAQSAQLKEFNSKKNKTIDSAPKKE